MSRGRASGSCDGRRGRRAGCRQRPARSVDKAPHAAASAHTRTRGRRHRNRMPGMRPPWSSRRRSTVDPGEHSVSHRYSSLAGEGRIAYSGRYAVRRRTPSPSSSTSIRPAARRRHHRRRRRPLKSCTSFAVACLRTHAVVRKFSAVASAALPWPTSHDELCSKSTVLLLLIDHSPCARPPSPPLASPSASICRGGASAPRARLRRRRAPQPPPPPQSPRASAPPPETLAKLWPRALSLISREAPVGSALAHTW